MKSMQQREKLRLNKNNQRISYTPHEWRHSPSPGLDSRLLTITAAFCLCSLLVCVSIREQREEKNAKEKKSSISVPPTNEHIQSHTPILIACHNSASANTLSPPYTVRQTATAKHIDWSAFFSHSQVAFAAFIVIVFCVTIFGWQNCVARVFCVPVRLGIRTGYLHLHWHHFSVGKTICTWRGSALLSDKFRVLVKSFL